jgi:signal transduction histidine kinase
LIANLLERCAMPCHIAAGVDELCLEIGLGAGAAMISEEALTLPAIAQIHHVIEEQPAWSDFPLILLTVGGRVTVQSERLRELRARRRQYQIRDQMHQYAHAQEALRRSEKLAVTGRLAASIAHEINNPLEAVTNLLYLIRLSPDCGQTSKYLTDAEQELARVAEIVKQALRFYREPHHPVETEVGAVLHSVLVLYNSRLASADIAVEVESLNSSATVLASPGELRQVMANLIGNAIDAMRHGGRLCIRVSTTNQRLRLTIADTGSGIPPALLPAIFEPFVTTKGETGTGLGLWVTGEIIRRNGWTIRVRSRSGAARSGTAFSITMPLSSAAQLTAIPRQAVA